MSNHNYSQYSKKQNKHNDNRKFDKPANKIPVESIKPIPEMQLVEETVETVTLPAMVEGTVVNCAKLNVRAEPTTDAAVVCVLDAMSEIEIDVAKSTDEWFKVCTAIGVEGYCMRKFVDAYL